MWFWIQWFIAVPGLLIGGIIIAAVITQSALYIDRQLRKRYNQPLSSKMLDKIINDSIIMESDYIMLVDPSRRYGPIVIKYCYKNSDPSIIMYKEVLKSILSRTINCHR